MTITTENTVKIPSWLGKAIIGLLFSLLFSIGGYFVNSLDSRIADIKDTSNATIERVEESLRNQIERQQSDTSRVIKDVTNQLSKHDGVIVALREASAASNATDEAILMTLQEIRLDIRTMAEKK